MFKKFVSLLMCVVFLFSFITVSASAKTVTEEEWNEYFATLDNTQISITPGADETQLNFAWHSEWGVSTPKVRISKNADMSDFKEFKGRSGFSDVMEQRTNDVVVTGLEENTQYYYVYGLGNSFSEIYTYKTHSFDSFKILFVSDAQPNSENKNRTLAEQGYSWNQTLEAAFNNNDDISFIVNGGDITHHKDNTEEWDAFLAPEYLRSYPNATVMGNHDSAKYQYKNYFNNPNVYHGISPTSYGDGYWFRYGDVLFVMINAFKKNFFDTQMLIKNAVEANPDAKWRVAVAHLDPYGTGDHAYVTANGTYADAEVYEFRDRIVPALDYYDFDIMLNGHDHIYGRSYFMKDDKIMYNEDYNTGTVTDPEGILYLTATAASGNTNIYDKEKYDYPWLGMVYEEQHDCYSTIEFTDDGQLKIVTVDKVTGETIDTFNIVKTDYNYYEEDTTGGVIGHYFKKLMGEYFIIVEMFNDLFQKVSEIFSK